MIAARVCLLAAVLVAACSEPTPTVVVVRVEGRPTLGGVAALDVVVANAGGSVSQTFELGSRRLPLTFTVTPEGRSGELEVSVTARTADGAVRGLGRASATIVADARVDLELVVEPDDFVVNQQIVNAQLIVFDSDQAGRQLAVAPDGTFIVAWENDCPLQRCDQLARRFGDDAQPAVNGSTMNDGEFIVNQSPEYTESPSIAASGAGYFLSWVNRPDGAIDNSIKGAVLGPDGQHLGFGDVVVSDSLEEEGAPTTIARGDGSFVVVWERQRVAPATGREIRGRLFGADGTPLVNPVSGDSGDFQVAAEGTLPLTTPHGAGLVGGGFVVVWLEAGAAATNVRGRVFGANGVPATPADVVISALPSGAAYGPRAAATAEGFVVGWQAQAAGVPQLASAPLIVRRFVGNGTPASTELFVTPATSLLRATPALAVLPGGAIGVAWDDCGAGGDGDASSCGIRFRLLAESGLPLGDPIVVNTTTTGDQLSPSIAALADDAFVLAWSDPSAKPPDTDGSSVRARVIYPPADRRDGTIGALCGGSEDAVCNAADLTCQPDIQGNSRCHPTCTTSCPAGGVCLEGTYCAYQ